ncbi:photosynthetic complex putative assembly protein PuhB [Tropicimonas sp. IMCC34043]|uniref:photosynthetic complex putative assembly protein PuhB n=1 Tax=Tropicimonas sp. IMCC34043 TaxID=2248760 RepID=UPI000E22CE69|nr:photosynthetic complex putative assembly protein PuhB [Tropicimonas sp. IMCC34043]
MPHDDMQVEPIPGLPEVLPEGEHILWQGSPNPWALARDALLLRWVAGYFGLLAVWRVVAKAPQEGWLGAVEGIAPLLILGAVACVLIYGFAWAQARASLYTITNRRVAMRIGVALTLTMNLPFSRIGSADLQTRRDGTGTIAFDTSGGQRLGYLICWPHVRPWYMSDPQPALRAIPDAEKVARLLAENVHPATAVPNRAPTAVAAE